MNHHAHAPGYATTAHERVVITRGTGRRFVAFGGLLPGYLGFGLLCSGLGGRLEHSRLLFGTDSSALRFEQLDTLGV
jgi:hypothetical protein